MMLKKLFLSLVPLLMTVLDHSVDCLYLITDYFMDPSQSRAFLGACGMTLRDDCVYVSSHVDTFNVAKYAPNTDCWLWLDAGQRPGARYRLEIQRWDMEPAYGTTCRFDYLELHDGAVDNKTIRPLHRRFCGKRKPKIFRFPTQRHITMRFVTNSGGNFKGFRILAVKTLPPPCDTSEFLCQRERRCISRQLLCDGTNQCIDGLDEVHCSVWQRMMGGILTMGLAGMVGLGIGIFCVILLFCIFVSCCCSCSAWMTPVKHPYKHPKRQTPSANRYRAQRTPKQPQPGPSNTHWNSSSREEPNTDLIITAPSPDNDPQRPQTISLGTNLTDKSLI